jgi:hypothetical protein
MEGGVMPGTRRQGTAGGSRRQRALGVTVAALVLLATLAAVALAASTDFREPATSPEQAGIGPVGIVAADFDGDTDRDLATVNISGGNVTILRNNGSGNFGEPASSPVPAGSFPSGIAAADLDGDGDQDLVVSNQVSDDVTILRNNGTGRFREPASSPVPAGDTPVAVVAADLDGDTDKDLAVVDLLTPGNVTILRNNGSGKFTQPASSPESAGNDPVSIAAADLNGDGDRDLAVANQQSFNVTILRNTGSGDFTEPASSPESAGTFPQGIDTGNLDGVGRPDLAVANQGSDDVTILLNIGSHDFTQPVTSPEMVGDRPFTLAAADFDGDGFGDLAVPNHDIDNVTILHNGGSGDFAEVGTSPEGAGDAPAAVAAGDLDGDTDPDLAVANNGDSTVTILRNR